MPPRLRSALVVFAVFVVFVIFVAASPLARADKAQPAAPAPITPLTLTDVRAAEKPPQPVPPRALADALAAMNKLDDKDPARADKLYNLARLHAEHERYFRFQAAALAEKLRGLTAAGAPDDELQETRAELAEAEEKRGRWLESATKRYTELTANPIFAQFRRMDLSLVSLITLHLMQKQEEAARPLVKRLLAEFPETLSLPDAFLAFAEYFWEAGDVDKALSFYERMLAYPAATRWSYARYKAGFCRFAKKDWQKAMSDFVAVIKKAPGTVVEGDDVEDPAKRSAELLVASATRAAVWTYAQAGAADKAWAFLGGIDAARTVERMEQLAGDYALLGKRAEQAETFRQLAQRSQAEPPERCGWQARALEIAGEADAADRDHLVALDELVHIAHEVAMNMKLDEAAQRTCAEAATAAVAPVLARLLPSLRKADAETVEAARKLVAEYRQHIAPAAEGPALDLLAARIAAEHDRPCEALPAMLVVFRSQPESGPSPLREESAKAAVTAWNACRASAAPGDKKQDLAGQLVQDAPRLYAHGGEPRAARAFFQSLGQSLGPGAGAATSVEMEAQYRKHLQRVAGDGKSPRKGR